MLHKINFPPFTLRKSTKNRVWIVKKICSADMKSNLAKSAARVIILYGNLAPNKKVWPPCAIMLAKYMLCSVCVSAYQLGYWLWDWAHFYKWPDNVVCFKSGQNWLQNVTLVRGSFIHFICQTYLKNCSFLKHGSS